MNIAVLVNLLNIGGNALLIYGFNFYVEGVAWPTFISRTLAAIVLLLLLYYEKGNRGEDTINAAWLIVLTHGILGMLFWCMSFCLPNALRAAGDATYTMIVSTASMWIIRVGLSFVFQKTRLLGLMDYFNLPECYGALCVWLSMICDWLVRIMFFGARIFSGKWLNKKVI